MFFVEWLKKTAKIERWQIDIAKALNFRRHFAALFTIPISQRSNIFSLSTSEKFTLMPSSVFINKKTVIGKNFRL